MKRRNPIRGPLETALTRIGFLVLPRLPRRVILLLAKTFGWFAYHFSRRLNRVGFTNLDIAFHDEKTKREKKRILRQSYQSFALVLMDTFWFSRNTSSRINRWVSFTPSFDVLFQPKPHICVTAHYGNWEVLGMAVTERGYPLHSVAKRLKNPKVDAMFIEARHKNGQKIVRRDGAVRTLLRILMQQGKVGLVMDQNTKMSEGGQFVPFFGLPVLVSTTVAGLALKTGADIVVGIMTPQPDGSYLGDHAVEIPIAPYLSWENANAVTEVTRRITEELERILRLQPEHWLWTYKRWKYVPSGEDPEKFPFYRRNAV